MNAFFSYFYYLQLRHVSFSVHHNCIIRLKANNSLYIFYILTACCCISNLLQCLHSYLTFRDVFYSATSIAGVFIKLYYSRNCWNACVGVNFSLKFVARPCTLFSGENVVLPMRVWHRACPVSVFRQ